MGVVQRKNSHFVSSAIHNQIGIKKIYEGENIKNMKEHTNNKKLRELGIAMLVITIMFIVSMFAGTFINMGELDIYLPEGISAESFVPEKGIAEISADPHDSRHMVVHAKGRGREYLVNQNPEDGQPSFEYVKVLRGGMIVNEVNGNYSGYKSAVVTTAVYVLMLEILLAVSFVIRCRDDLFSYTTIYFGGAVLFMAGVAVSLAVVTLKMLSDPITYTMEYFYSQIKGAGGTFMLFSLPLLLIFSLALPISNISLIRREGLNFVNVLGFILSALIILSYLVEIFYVGRFVSGSATYVRITGAIDSTLTTCFAYLEDMLISAMICGIISVKRKVAFDKTHVMILGCAISDDGTPLPLLAGRVDRAIEFAKAQKAATGKGIKFVPSGGKGSDEVISEAESMRRYLISKGISDADIIAEDKSTSTEENMRFSLEKIKADCEAPKIVFSTSNYHVLRSGIISKNEGLDADGVGSKTRWYFWPNAAVREFVGLLVSKKKEHAFWAVFFIVLFAVINMIMPM
ncbi:MAG TPA: hypothetical protein DHV89_06400 [Ruminococcus sp.]|nr:hypothetical protein [Ruminococcus sp.]